MREEEPHARRPAPFFRTIGGVLGFRPSRGSLTGKNKRCNYLFASGDSTKIIRWNVKNLSVNFVACEDDIDCVEKDIVFGIKPMTNTRNNPEPFGSLKELREKCRDSARRQLRFNRRKQCVHPNDSATMRCGRTARVCFPIRLRTDSELVSLGIILCVPGFRCAGIADLTVRLFSFGYGSRRWHLGSRICCRFSGLRPFRRRGC